MANSAQARKRARQSVKQREHNTSLRSELRTAIKKVAKAIEAGDKAAAQAVFSASTSVVDGIADKKIIHKNAIRAACPPLSRRWPDLSQTISLRQQGRRSSRPFSFLV